MRIEIKFKNHGHETIDFIELKNEKTGEIITLDWDETNFDDGDVYGRGVHMNRQNEDANENETYGNGRLSELKNFVFSTAQAYNLDTEKERSDVEIISILVDDDGDMYNVPII